MLYSYVEDQNKLRILTGCNDVHIYLMVQTKHSCFFLLFILARIVHEILTWELYAVWSRPYRSASGYFYSYSRLY
jgi:hypothetical protein